MAEIETGEHNDGEAARMWLARAADADPDPAWVCRECGAVAVDWSAACPSCEAFDSLEWRVPSHVPPLSLRGPLVLHESKAVTPLARPEPPMPAEASPQPAES
jgi:HemY protein